MQCLLLLSSRESVVVVDVMLLGACTEIRRAVQQPEQREPNRRPEVQPAHHAKHDQVLHYGLVGMVTRQHAHKSRNWVMPQLSS